MNSKVLQTGYFVGWLVGFLVSCFLFFHRDFSLYVEGGLLSLMSCICGSLLLNLLGKNEHELEKRFSFLRRNHASSARNHRDVVWKANVSLRIIQENQG